MNLVLLFGWKPSLGARFRTGYVAAAFTRRMRSAEWDNSLKKNLRATRPAYGLVTDTGKPTNEAAAKILVACKEAWMKGQRDAES